MNEAETEILAARRAFPTAQELLAGEPTGDVSLATSVGWHDVSLSPHAGAFAVASFGGPFAEMVGEVLRVSARGRVVYVYLVGRAATDDPLSLSRRAFLGLGELMLDTIDAIVETVG